MRIHFVQHVPFEGPGSISDWAATNQYKTSYTKIFETVKFPLPEDFDILIIMGGPMGVYEEEKYEWMKAEKSFIKNAIDQKKKVLGICLGAQFVAAALGSTVFQHGEKEIGWLPVQKASAHSLTNHFPQIFTTFHWHGDTFNLPKGAIQLFKTGACEQQGFIYDKHVAALQFHAEVKQDLLDGMTKHEKAELIKNTYVQTEDEIKQLTPRYIHQQKEYMHGFLDAFIKF
jgi:GMP synthase-like glutamine amidotransferase